MLKKTKIVCTMGPTTEKEGILAALIDNGMDCARFNFSHGDHAEHLRRLEAVRSTAEEKGKIIATILDTRGPEMRLGEFSEGSVMLDEGQEFTLTYEDEPGNKDHVSINHKALYTEVKPGDRLLLADGLVGLDVLRIEDKNIVTKVLNAGQMSTKKRVAAPGISLSLPPISEQDKKDILFGIQHDMDFVAASFVQRAEDVNVIRKLIKDNKGRMEIISKIENLEGVKNIDAIIEASDGIMVARGDLGVEIPVEDVPMIQKNIVTKCNKVGKPVIVATQMLESMTQNPRPTRAEASDVANAILDGTDAIMLSGETANGSYPVETVETMNRIAQRTESSLHFRKLIIRQGVEHLDSVTDAIAHATVQLAYEIAAEAIITPTASGYTTRVVSKYRPKADIIAYTANSGTARHLQLRWGVHPIAGKYWDSVEETDRAAVREATRLGYISHGIRTIMTSGFLPGKGHTNSIRICTVD